MAVHRDGGEPVERMIKAAEECLERGDAEAALAWAERARAATPSSTRALHIRAAALSDMGRTDDARSTYEQALARAKDLDLIADAADFYQNNCDAYGTDWIERGLELARAGLKLARRADDDGFAIVFAILEASALARLGDPRAGLACIESALRAYGADADLLVERGIMLFELCRFGEAHEQLSSALSEFDDAWAHHTLGLIEERFGHTAEAELHFETARRISPDDFTEPVRLSPEAFDRAVENALAELPPNIRGYLSNVAITVEDIPADEELLASEPPLSPSILGIFRGAPLQEKASMDPWSHFPSGIALYQKNLERVARDRTSLVEEIRVTLLHEVGHFLGLDEHDLWERGLD